MSFNVYVLNTSHRHISEVCSSITFIGRKEGNVLFNDALNTFYLRLYGDIHMVKYHSDYRVRKPAAATWATLSN